MKKEFRMPRIKRIELNMNENIANSGSSLMGYWFLNSAINVCTLQGTDKLVVGTEISYDEWQSCSGTAVNSARSGGRTLLSNDEVFPYM